MLRNPTKLVAALDLQPSLLSSSRSSRPEVDPSSVPLHPAEQIEYAPGLGDELLSAPWGEGAISTAEYKGVALRHVLEYFGGVEDETAHCEFIGADTYFKKNKVFNYAVSVPWRKM